jgi:23S rRNA pseudouridine2457 synthase
VGFPTLRLVRIAIGSLDIFSLGLTPGDSVDVATDAPFKPAQHARRTHK